MEETEKKETIIKFELGDIIEIHSPNNHNYHQKIFIIDYIDENVVELINVSNKKREILNKRDGFIRDESILSIGILDRSELKGFARQNALYPNNWITLELTGDLPITKTAKIVDLVEDRIEIKTFPENETLYIDFGYSGIPKNIPIKSITIRPEPLIAKASSQDDLTEEEILEEASVTYTDSGEMIIDVPENALPDKNFSEKMEQLFIDSSDIVFGDEIETTTQMEELNESERRYNLEVQANDMLDQLLSIIPFNKRTSQLLENINKLIRRFKELRNKFSKFDSNNIAISEIKKGPLYKPLVEKLKRLDFHSNWIIPVVINKRHLYKITGDDEEENPDNKLLQELNQINEYFDIYNNNNTNDRYTSFYKNIDKILHPFEKLYETDSDNYLLENEPIFRDMDCILDSFGNMDTTGINNDDDITDNLKFFIQRYITGLQKRELIIGEGKQKRYKSVKMTDNDSIDLKSLLVLPNQMINLYSINLPNKTIYERLNLHNNYVPYFKILNKNTKYDSYIIDNLSQELDYSNEENHKFLENIVEYKLDDKLINETDKLENLLNVIIPNSRFLIKHVLKENKNKMSIVEIIKLLEPFLIYEDNISYSHYNEIRYMIKEELLPEFNKNKEKRQRELNGYLSILSENNNNLNDVEKLFFGNSDLYDKFMNGYSIENKQLTSSELLSKISVKDGLRLFTSMLSILKIEELNTPEDLLKLFEPANLEDLSNLEKINSKDCTRKYLSKEYTSIDQLEKDQYTEDVFFDDKYDDTPYEMIKEYESKKKSMDGELFKEYLIENLIQKHNIKAESAEELAIDLINKKKKVRDGHYALLLTKPTLDSNIDKDSLTEKEKQQIEIEEKTREKKGYYYRVKDQWVKDDKIDDEMFIDTNTLFCNITANCYKNEETKVCENDDLATRRLTALSRIRMKEEFDNRINLSFEELKNQIEERLNKYYKSIHKMDLIENNNLYKHDRLEFAIGSTLLEEEKVVSPYADIMRDIIDQTDFVKKQYDILKFREMCCREPLQDVEIEENQYYYYCKITNKKLLPMFYVNLAEAYMNNTYEEELNMICAKQGAISDDGDEIVDLNSGESIRKIDFMNQDMYNEEGFKVITYSEMGEEIETTLKKIDKKMDITFENEQNKQIYNILYTLCDNMGIEMDSIKDFVIQYTNEFIKEIITPEKIYNDRAKKKVANGEKEPIKYDIYKNRLIFWIISSCLLISIQTNENMLNIKKSFENCIRSFDGYPLTGIENVSGIEYISCVMYNLKNDIEPWNSIKKLKKEVYVEKIKDIIEKHLIKNTTIENLYLKRKEYILLNNIVFDEIPQEHSLNKWTTFLPPIVPIKLKSISAPTKDFYQELMKKMKDGSHHQHDMLNVLKSKLYFYGYGITEMINNIVQKQEPLLTTISKNPFLENACCHSDSRTTLDYFGEKNGLINQYSKIVKNISEFVDEVRVKSKPKILFHSDFTGIKYPKISETLNDDNVYGTFIKYCNMNDLRPIPQEYQFLFEEKLASFPANSKLDDQIEFLKKSNKKFTKNDLYALMNIVRNKNKILVDNTEKYDEKAILQDIINKFDLINSNVVEDKLRSYLMSLLDKYDPKVMVFEERKELKELKNYLVLANERLYNEIVGFIDVYGNLDDKTYDIFQDFLLNVTKTNMSSKDAIYNVTKFIKNSIYNMTKLYPSIFMNNSNYYDYIPSHWELSDLHQRDIKNIYDKYWKHKSLLVFDEVVINSILDVQTKLKDLYLLMDNIPIHMSIERDGKTFVPLLDNECIYFLYIYFWYSTIFEYIDAANNKDNLILDKEKNKRIRMRDIDIERDESQTMMGINIEDVEENLDLQEVTFELGNEDELKYNLAKIILFFVNMEQQDKPTLMSYDEIKKKTYKQKLIEKKKITDYLGSFDDKFERELENQYKKYKMKQWNVGREIVQYDKNYYDSQRENLIPDDEIEVLLENIEEPNMDNRLGELDAIDIDHFGPEYYDGDFYGESNMEDEFEET